MGPWGNLACMGHCRTEKGTLKTQSLGVKFHQLVTLLHRVHPLHRSNMRLTILNQEGTKMIKPLLRILCLGLLSGLLYGCGGDAQVGDRALITEDHKKPAACADIYEPVCSV